MTKTAKNQHEPVTITDILNGYCITQDPKIGSEVEHVVLHPDRSLITARAHRDLSTLLTRANIPHSAEPLASIFELKTRPHKSAAALIHDMTPLKNRFHTAVRAAGYCPVETGYLGHVTLDDAMHHRIPNERADGLLDHFIRNGHAICARQPLMTASVHISISYRDINHAFEMAKLLMVATPILTAICANGGDRIDGRVCTINPSTTIRLSQQGGRGGLSPIIADATSPIDLMRRQANHIATTPMMMHLNAHDAMCVHDDAGNHPSFTALRGRGLNHASNALLSESMQYHLLKFTSIRDQNGHAIGKRLELRMADNGPFQHDFMARISDAITFNDDFRADLTALFTRAGLNPHGAQTGHHAMAALNKIASTPRAQTTHIAYGTQTIGTLAQAMTRMVDTLKPG